MKKRSFTVGNKTIKLREDRAFYRKCLIIAQNRPELLVKMPELIGNYEMSIIPRSVFSPDGSPLLCVDKASLMTRIIAHQPVQGQLSVAGDREKVLIIDAMVEAKALRKRDSDTKLVNLKQAFISRIKNKAAGGYQEIRVLFDQWKKDSLKEKTRNKRAENTGISTDEEDKGFDMHDDMIITETKLTALMGTNTSKTQIAAYFADGLLQEYNGNENVKLIVTYGEKICINRPHSLKEEFQSHSHEEADTQIPLHIVDALSESSYKHIDIYSTDTDVLVLLIDLVSSEIVGPLTNVIMHAGKGRALKPIDVVDRVKSIGMERSRGLVGMHQFTGNDYGAKFVGVTKDRWAKQYLKLPPNHEIVRAFSSLGTLEPEQCALDASENLHPMVRPLETFVCMTYNKEDPSLDLPNLRYKLWSKKSTEGENLPPCRATLAPVIKQSNFLSRLYKSYRVPHPELPLLTISGWVRDKKTNTIQPEHCLLPPAPKSIMELVKCQCPKGDCSSAVCSCKKNDMLCTSLCGCSDRCVNDN